MNGNWTRHIAGSFPASDPPPWTLGASSWMDLEAPVPKTGSSRPSTEVIVRDGYRVGGIRLASLGEAIALAAMVPLAILIAGVPVVALVWGVANAVSWLDRQQLIYVGLFPLEWRCRPM